MHGYSDQISHALAFAAKYYGAMAPTRGVMAFLAQPANVAIILTRYGCDQPTVMGGILHHVLEEVRPGDRALLEKKIVERFGSVVLAIARDALEQRYDAHGNDRPWRTRKQDYLVQLAVAEPRAVDVCVADELHRCGSTITALRRLGVEYLRTVSSASSDQMIWWYRSMLEVLDRRPDWPRREMLSELRQMSADLVRSVRGHEIA